MDPDTSLPLTVYVFFIILFCTQSRLVHLSLHIRVSENNEIRERLHEAACSFRVSQLCKMVSYTVKKAKKTPSYTLGAYQIA
jgi:hypothetical protein